MKRFWLGLVIVFMLASCSPSDYGEFIREEYAGYDGTLIPITFTVKLEMGDVGYTVSEMAVYAQRATQIISYYETGTITENIREEDCAWRIPDEIWKTVEALAAEIDAKADLVDGYYARLGVPVTVSQDYWSSFWEQESHEYDSPCSKLVERGRSYGLTVRASDSYDFGSDMHADLTYLDGLYYLAYRSDAGGEFTMKIPSGRLIGIAEAVFGVKEVSLENLVSLDPAELTEQVDYSTILSHGGRYEVATFSFPHMDLKARTFFFSELGRALPLMASDTGDVVPVWAARLQSGQEAHGYFDTTATGAIAGFIAFSGFYTEEGHGEYSVELQELMLGSVYLAPVTVPVSP